jgi:ribosome recycling factor
MDDQYTAGVKSKMLKALDVTKSDIGTVRTGRATPALVENIIIPAYGGSQKMKVMEMATISATDNRSLVIVPFDPSTREEIIKGIQESNAGLTPISDGEQIRITIPPLTEERRQEYLKLARAKLEAGRIMIRQIRHEEMAKLKRTFEAKDITEDDRKRLEKQYQEITDEMIGEIDRLGDLKEKELMQI